MRGANKLRRTLKRMGPEATAEVRKVLADGTQLILFNARSRVPVDTGNLRYELEAKTSSDGMSGRIGLVGKKAKKAAFYGRFVEFGTKRQAARPFLVPAYEQSKDWIMTNLRKALDRTLAKIIGQGGLD